MEIKDILRFKRVNELKSIYRLNSVGKRKESSAEHSWSCLMLADFLLTEIKTKINRERVYELLMYHDLVEIETGDVPSHPNIKIRDKSRNEEIAANKLKKILPNNSGNKFIKLFKEFEEVKTKEAKFAKAVDALDAIIHEMDYKKDWKGWTADFLIKTKGRYFEEFPELKKIFYELLEWLEKEGYFDQ